MLSAEFGLYPVVAIVGRVNVGKSTLFNTLLEEKKAVVSAVPGTTRDVNYGIVTWRGKTFILVDTGGYTGGAVQHYIEKKTAEHAQRMIRTADIVVFLTDKREGLNPDDRRFVKDIRKISRAPLVLAVNKAEQKRAAEGEEWSEWHKLGLGAPLYLSAINGRGTGDLLDIIVNGITEKKIVGKELDTTHDEVRVAIVGRTNVGKSSILNRMLGEERVIVSPQHHTTREPQDTLLQYDGIPLRIIDTVGMRKKSSVSSRMDREGLLRSMNVIERADIVILTLESMISPSKQESRLVGIAKEHGAGLVIAVNKWDLVEEKTTKTPKSFEDFFKSYFKGALWAPVIFVSALSGHRVGRILEIVRLCIGNREKRIAQEELDAFLNRTIAHQKPQIIKGKKKPVIYGLLQKGINPPTFALLVNERTSISFSYLRYLENRLRDIFGFVGTPLRIHTEEKDTRKKI